MEPARPAFLPDPDRSREEMEALQRDIAAAATFEDDLAFDPADVGVAGRVDPAPADGQASLGGADAGGPLVAGVDQAFLDDLAVSAVVVLRGDRVVARAHAAEPLTIPYVPGLLSFREGGPVVSALAALSVEPDLLLFDGSGRIHYRQAGLATHLGVVFDAPSVGVAKRLLCGTPRGPVEGLAAGERVAVEADDRVEAEPGTRLGYALQTRQFTGDRRVNPLYVSPGHRVGAETSADLALTLCADRKLPEPVRLADRYADAVKEDCRAGGG